MASALTDASLTSARVAICINLTNVMISHAKHFWYKKGTAK